MNEQIGFQVGDIAVYGEGNAFLMNQVVYVHALTYGGSRKIAVCTLVPWTIPLGWCFGVEANELTVIHHVEPAGSQDRMGYTFSPEWLDSIVPGVKQALSSFVNNGGVIPRT